MAYDSKPVGKKHGVHDFPFPSPLRSQIKSGQLCLGTATPATSDMRVVGTIVNKDIDWIWIDCEHGWAASVEGVGAACVLARSRGVAPIIRVAWNDPALIKKALDMGAVGVMVPQVQNAAEAKAAVDAARYYPEGTRGISPPWTSLAGMGMDGPVLEKIMEETVVMVQLESVEAYNNLQSIAAVPGIDVLMVGPLDLSATVGAMGDTRAPAVLKIMEDVPKVLAKCGTGVMAATTLGPYEHHELAVKWGYSVLNVGNPLAYGLDVVMEMSDRLRTVDRPKL